MSTTPYREYGGLASVPGPFRCSDATVTVLALPADPGAVAALCATALAGSDGTSPYRPLGSFVLLTFGAMTVRSESGATSPLFGSAYDAMGSSTERHVAFWVPMAATHRAHHVEVLDRVVLFTPVMWVDNPVSLVGGREIYGINKQWGTPVVTAGAAPGCTLEVFGGDFGREEASGMQLLLEVAPRPGSHPVEAAGRAVEDVGRAAADAIGRLLRGEVTLPDGDFVHQVASALQGRRMAQVTARQFRVPTGNGADGSPVELVELTSTFHAASAHLVAHGFDVTLHPVASHPVARMLGLAATQRVPFAVEVKADFTLSV